MDPSNPSLSALFHRRHDRSGLGRDEVAWRELIAFDARLFWSRREIMLPPLRPPRPLLHLLPPRRRLSADSSDARPPAPPPDAAAATAEEEVAARREAYKQVQNLDFMTAAKILFTVPPKRKKFGFDFHLVQLFFACMPSLAVYLVAQYARHEIKRMEAEVEEEKKKEELEKAKQLELESVEEDTNTKLSKVLVRLDMLEEVVKEIVDDKRKTSSNLSTNQENSPPNRASALKSNANVSELATIKSKDTSGVTNPPLNTTQENPKWNGDRVPSVPKT